MAEFSFVLPLRADQDESESESASFPLPAAQAMELCARYQSAQELHALRPGDLCVEKDGLGSMRQENRGRCILIVWRLLDLSNWMDQKLVERFLSYNLAGTDRLDCVVASVDGGVLTVYPHQLALLRKWEEA